MKKIKIKEMNLVYLTKHEKIEISLFKYFKY